MLSLTLLQALLHDVHRTEQFAQIVTAYLLLKQSPFFLQLADALGLAQYLVVQFLDDGGVVTVGTLARGVGLDRFTANPLRSSADLCADALRVERHLQHLAFHSVGRGDLIVHAPYLARKFLFCHSCLINFIC